MIQYYCNIVSCYNKYHDTNHELIEHSEFGCTLNLSSCCDFNLNNNATGGSAVRPPAVLSSMPLTSWRQTEFLTRQKSTDSEEATHCRRPGSAFKRPKRPWQGRYRGSLGPLSGARTQKIFCCKTGVLSPSWQLLIFFLNNPYYILPLVRLLVEHNPTTI